MHKIAEAIVKARTYSDDWQAECCEILMIPAIQKRWQELNDHAPGLRLERVDGFPHLRKTPDDNQAIGEAKEWSRYAGFTLVLSSGPDWASRWNSVRDDYYGHAPSTAWNGVGRNTVCQFVEALRMIALGHDHPEHRRTLERAKIAIQEACAA